MENEADRKVIFQNEQSDFEKELVSRVRAYFQQPGKSKRANVGFFLKGGLLVSITLAAYVSIYLVPPTWGWLTLSYVLFGFFSATLIFNIGHDAMHGSVSRNPLVNRLLGYSWNLAGISSYIWKLRHNLAHHAFTNVPGTDYDVAQSGLLRLDPSASLRPIHRYQGYYLPFLFALLTINLVFIKDFQMLGQQRFGNHRITHSTARRVRIVMLKIFYLVYALFLPMLVVGAAWWVILSGFLMMHIVAGLFASAVLVPVHLNPASHFSVPDATGRIQSGWLEHQLAVTVDFSAQTPAVGWLTGGLNYHIAHHLFPSVCHVHYPSLTRIIRQTARKHGKLYVNKSWGRLIYDSMRFARDLGQKTTSEKYLRVQEKQ